MEIVQPYGEEIEVTSINGLTGDITLASGSNITITPTGNTLTIASTGGGGGSPAGSNTQIQFNDSGVFGGDAGFTYDKTVGNLGLKQNILFQNLITGDPHTFYVYPQTNPNTAGGGLNFNAADGDGTGAGGTLLFYAGNGGTNGNGGDIILTAGINNTGGGTPGVVHINSGSNQFTGGNGGDIYITTGAGNSGGSYGKIAISTGGPIAFLNTYLLTSTDQSYQFPDQSGTFALTSDIPDVSGFLTDAPADGTTYGRKDNTWSAVPSGSGVSGQATVTFGTGIEEDSITKVTINTPSALTTSIILVSPAGVATADHDPDDYQWDNISGYVSNIINGVSFDIIGVAPNGSWGQYKFNYIIN